MAKRYNNSDRPSFSNRFSMSSEMLPNDEASSESDQNEEKIKISFSHWFADQVKKGRLRAHQELALKTFMAKNNLSKSEDLDLYNEALTRF